MTEKEVISAFADKTGKTLGEAKELIDAYTSLVVDTAMTTGKCSFGKIGTFKKADVKATAGRKNVENALKPGTFYDIAPKAARTKLAFGLSKSGKLIGA